jgi:glycyl-tRNA synthetase beta chain
VSGRTLLVEIGCEELPYRFCESVLRQLGHGDASSGEREAGLAEKLLAEARLLPQAFRREDLGVLVSPRRIAVLVRGVPDRQEPETQRSRGPRASVAFGADGAPTKAGEGFARGRGLAVADLGRETVDGVEFVVAEVEAPRADALAVLPDVVAKLIAGIQVPRGMRWGRRPRGADDYLRFSRPIRWIVAKLGEETVRAPFYDMEIGDVSRGHRVLGASVTVDAADRYDELLRDAAVVVDQDERRRIVAAGLEAAATAAGGTWFDPGDVLAEAIYLAEWPSVAGGVFHERHLRLPREVLVTAMQSHQRYFPVRTADDALLPVFLYVSNADPAAADAVTRGNQRVLDGRLADAEFAYDRDLAEGLPAMAGRLGTVVFHEKLGSLADKARRLSGLVAGLASGTTARGETGAPVAGDAGQTAEGGASVTEALAAEAKGGNGSSAPEDPLAADLRRAAALAKADLVSQVVIEFPSLQGAMGETYARAAGEAEAVARAVGEQYLPVSATAPVPATLAGGLLAVAEKADNIVGAWVAGQKPSGSRDPYGLRRAAMGIVRIALQYTLRIPVRGLLDSGLDQYEVQGVVELDDDARATMLDETQAFVLERLQALLLDEGLPFAVVEAALGAAAGDVPALAARARSFAALAGRDILEDTAVAYDRCASLASKAAGAGGAPQAPDPALFCDEAERALAAALADVAPGVLDALGHLEIESALVAAAPLRAAVDRYFDDVLVMDPDDKIRENRLAQLAAVTGLLGRIGALDRLPTQEEAR